MMGEEERIDLESLRPLLRTLAIVVSEMGEVAGSRVRG